MGGFTGATRSAPNVAVPLHALFEAVSDGVLITDAAGTRTYSNQAMQDLLGVDPAADSTSAAPAWLPQVHQARYHEVIRRTAQSDAGEEIVMLEWAIIDSAGVEHAVIARLFPVRGPNGGDSSAVLWLMQPVHPKPEAEVPSAEWAAALERIANEVQRLGFGAHGTATPISHGYEGADRLTRREQDVVQCLLEGERVVSIAERLDLSPHTVRNHLKSIFRKLDVHSQAELVRHVRG
jgi:DNA-binding CsgD family transcriptional regulator